MIPIQWRLLLVCWVVLIGQVRSDVSTDALFKTSITAWASTTSDVLLQALSLAYSLEALGVSLGTLTEAGGYPSGKTAIMNNQCDFAFTATVLSSVDQSVYPNLIEIPFVAVPIVPIFNLGNPSLQLILTRQTLALIFNRTITMWNDPLIVRDNNSTGVLTVNLPAQPITVILPLTTRTISTQFNNALQKLYPAVQQSINVINNQSKYSSNPASDVASTVYSISFSQYQAAVRVGASIAIFESAAGQRIAINQTNIDEAVTSAVSVRIQNIANIASRQVTTLDLYLAPGITSWPFIATEYLLIDLQTSRSTCAVRGEVVDFLVWAYSSDTAADIMTQQQVTALPVLYLTQADIIHRLQSTIMCRGYPASVLVAANGVVVSGDPRTNTINSLLLIEYNSQLSTEQAAAYQYVWTPNPSPLALQQMLVYETSLAMVFEEAMTPQFWQEGVIQNNKNWAVPIALFAVEFAFNTQLNSVVKLPASSHMSLTLQMLVLIFFGVITDWRDPMVLSVNPDMAAAFAADSTNTPAPITQIIACDSFSPQAIGSFAAMVLNYWLPDLMPPPSSIPNLCAVNLFAGTNATVKYVQTESQCGPAASVTTGAFVYRPTGEDVLVTVGTIDILHEGTVRSSTADNMLACVDDVIDHNLLVIPAHKSLNPNCYLFTQTMYAVTPNTLFSALSGPASCVSGRLSLNYVTYLYNLSNINTALRSAGAVRVAESEAVRSIIDASLQRQGLTCDGVSLLRAGDVVYSVDDSLHNFGVAVTTAGIAATFVGAAALVVFRKHTVVVLTKLSFSLISSVGIMCLFASVLAVASPVSDTSCGALMWLINIGFTLLFGPMLLKTGRLYAMHGGGNIVTKSKRWKTHHLLQALGAAIALDLSILVAWQGAEPFTVIRVDRILDDDARHIYNMCGQETNGLPFLIVMSLAKSMALVLGALMAFTLRRLSTSFDELKHVSILIYNSLVVLALFVPLGITQVGDARTALFIVAILWISVVAWVVLFVPKFIAFTATEHELKQQEDVSQRTDEVITESQGFTFGEIGGMREEVLASYIHALTAQVEKLRQIVKVDDNSESKQEPSSHLSQANNQTKGLSRKNSQHEVPKVPSRKNSLTHEPVKVFSQKNSQTHEPKGISRKNSQHT